MPQTFFLINESVRKNCVIAINSASDDSMVTIKTRTRSSQQNAYFHKLCGEVSKQGLFGNRKLTTEQWKVLFVSGHAIATKIGVDMTPGIEGEWVNLRESTSKMSVARLSSVIDYVSAWCVSNNIRIPAYMVSE